MKRICVYCGSSPGTDPVYMEMAGSLGEALLKEGIELVYGGAEIGLMGRVADTVMEGGGVVTGVIPKSFADRVSHKSLTRLHVVDSMHERKTMMFELSDGFIALPGGFGTLEELAEMLTWAHLGFHSKPCGVLNVDRYYDYLLKYLDHAVEKGFMTPALRGALLVADTPDALLALMKEYVPPNLTKWEI